METTDYEAWLNETKEALVSINMAYEDWQNVWAYGFRRDFDSGISPGTSAMKANRYWWYQQNKSIGQECRKAEDCWLPRNHHGNCQSYLDESTAHISKQG